MHFLPGIGIIVVFSCNICYHTVPCRKKPKKITRTRGKITVKTILVITRLQIYSQKSHLRNDTFDNIVSSNFIHTISLIQIQLTSFPLFQCGTSLCIWGFFTRRAGNELYTTLMTSSRALLFCASKNTAAFVCHLLKVPEWSHTS